MTANPLTTPTKINSRPATSEILATGLLLKTPPRDFTNTSKYA